MLSSFLQKKSHHGCNRCKERHVKCNEQAPCHHCVRRKEQCSLLRTHPYLRTTPAYPGPSVPSKLSSPPAHQENPGRETSAKVSRPSTSLASTPNSTLGTSRTGWQALDLYLMSYFTSSTAHTFSSRPELSEAWQTVIVKNAVSYPFLLHSILATAACHLASQPRPPGDTEFEYERAFRHHQDEAITQYRAILDDFHGLDVDEFEARSKKPWPAGPVFATSVLTAMLAVASISDSFRLPSMKEALVDSNNHSRDESSRYSDMANADPGTKHEAVLERIISIFVAIRGVRSVASAAWEQNIFTDTAYRFLMTPFMNDVDLAPLPTTSSIPSWYDHLRTHCMRDLFRLSSGDDKEARQLCDAALYKLEFVHHEVVNRLDDKKQLPKYIDATGEPDPDIAWFLKWTATVSHGFLSMIRAQHPAALVILSQFVTICGRAEEGWYLRSWMENAIGAIKYAVGAGEARDWVDKIIETWAKGSEKVPTA